jgi:hypothetical protein
VRDIDDYLADLCDKAGSEANVFGDMLENEGAFRGIRKLGGAEKWAVFDGDECRVQAIFDLAKMLAREPEVKE